MAAAAIGSSSPVPPRLRACWGRFLFALAGSVFLHLLLSAIPVTQLPGRFFRGYEAKGSHVTVRLELSQPPSLADLNGPETAAPLPATPVSRKNELSRAEAPSRMPVTGSASALLLRPPESAVYFAGDLDDLPRLIAPLDLAKAPKSGTLLELWIDEQGFVNHVAVAEPAGRDGPEAEMVVFISMARFVPARKDGRAVKSRVTVRIGPELRSK